MFVKENMSLFVMKPCCNSSKRFGSLDFVDFLTVLRKILLFFNRWTEHYRIHHVLQSWCDLSRFRSLNFCNMLLHFCGTGILLVQVRYFSGDFVILRKGEHKVEINFWQVHVDCYFKKWSSTNIVNEMSCS